jgi:hypothetical protein
MISTNIIVSNEQSIRVTASITGFSSPGIAASIGEIDTTNVGDGYVFTYNSVTQKFEFQDPDVMLSNAVQDNSLPQTFINKLDDNLDNKIDADGGIF